MRTVSSMCWSRLLVILLSDIFPEGWDKTYVLKHFPESDWDVFFVGDRCSPSGNDWELYNHLQPLGRSFETSGPEETVEIIDIHLHRLVGELG